MQALDIVVIQINYLHIVTLPVVSPPIRYPRSCVFSLDGGRAANYARGKHQTLAVSEWRDIQEGP